MNPAVYHTQSGSEPEPAYTFRYPDPATPAARNCYAVALFDAYNTEVLYGEVLLKPRWTHPTLSQDEIRKNGGVPPPPEPLLPLGFTIQLYDPDQQINVAYKESGLLGSAKWDFSMPQDNFRTPSASMIDKSLHDPGAATTTPRINFSWKKEKIGRELVCFYTGKSTDGLVKRRHKEPDVTCAILKSLKQLTVYESNTSRIDLEDPKGFEVVLLLSAAVIRDVYFGQLRQAFNIAEIARNATPNQSSSSTPPVQTTYPLRVNQSAAVGALYNSQPPAHAAQIPTAQTPSSSLDPRTQWEIDQETARLRAIVDEEARIQQQQDVRRRKELERQAEEETKRLRRLVEQEEQERRRKLQDVERETERLRQQYGMHGQDLDNRAVPPPPRPPPGWHGETPQMPGAWPSPAPPQEFYAPPPQTQYQSNQGYQGPPPPAQFAGSSFDGSGHATSSQGRPPANRPHRSFWDLRSENRLSKKSSSAW